MDAELELSINHLFGVFRSRADKYIAPLPPAARKELEEQLDLLRQSVLNRVAEGDRL